MSAAINGQDIRKGDLIRKEYDTTHPGTEGTKAVEFWAERDGDQLAHHPGKCFLMERPVQLPTAIGYHLDKEGSVWYRQSTGANDGHHWQDSDGERHPDQVAQRFAPFTLLRPVAEVAAEVLAEVRGSNMRNSELDAIAAKWATK